MRNGAQTYMICLLLAGYAASQVGCGTFLTGPTGTANYDTLVLKFQADRRQVRVGESVHMRFTVTNQGAAWGLESPDTPVMDITVQVVGGETLLVWSAQNPDQVSHRLEWQKGESKVIEWAWTPKPGDIYTGADHDVFLTGMVYRNSQSLQAAGVRICASNVCR